MPDYQPDSASEPVHLLVDDLPADVAQKIREVQLDDPEFLKNVLLYGITHKTVFDTLRQGWGS